MQNIKICFTCYETQRSNFSMVHGCRAQSCGTLYDKNPRINSLKNSRNFFLRYTSPSSFLPFFLSFFHSLPLSLSFYFLYCLDHPHTNTCAHVRACTFSLAGIICDSITGGAGSLYRDFSRAARRNWRSRL